MNVLQSLQQLNLYPIPDSVIVNCCGERGLNADEEITAEIRKSRPYLLTKADVYKWLAFAPATVSQGGVSFSLSESDKKRFIEKANKLYAQTGENVFVIGTVYGYKGSRL